MQSGENGLVGLNIFLRRVPSPELSVHPRVEKACVRLAVADHRVRKQPITYLLLREIALVISVCSADGGTGDAAIREDFRRGNRENTFRVGGDRCGDGPFGGTPPGLLLGRNNERALNVV